MAFTHDLNPRFVETVEIGPDILANKYTRADWTKFIAEVREGKHDWPGTEIPKPKGKPVVLKINDDYAHLNPGDSYSVRAYGDFATVTVIG